MKHLDLFSGIGGFALAARWAEIETVAFCEIDEKCYKVLNKNFPNIPVYKDINFLNGEDFAGIDIITGGYPCQPFSVAGVQNASEDARHLWPQMFRIIAQAKPTWAICENVYGHIGLGLDGVLHNLESIGYACQSFVIPALATGANHNRERVFIVAYAASNGRNESTPARSDETIDDDNSQRQEQTICVKRCGSLRFGVDWRGEPIGRWGVEPPALRVDAKFPDRMDRNRMLGNAIDPVIAFEIFKTIKRFTK